MCVAIIMADPVHSEKYSITSQTLQMHLSKELTATLSNHI